MVFTSIRINISFLIFQTSTCFNLIGIGLITYQIKGHHHTVFLEFLLRFLISLNLRSYTITVIIGVSNTTLRECSATSGAIILPILGVQPQISPLDGCFLMMLWLSLYRLGKMSYSIWLAPNAIRKYSYLKRKINNYTTRCN